MAKKKDEMMESIRIVVSVKPPVARVDTAENGPSKVCAEPIENQNAQEARGSLSPGGGCSAGCLGRLGRRASQEGELAPRRVFRGLGNHSDR